MALSIDGTATASGATGVALITAVLTTTNTNDIICVYVHCEAINSTGAHATVSSITSAGLAFVKRSQVFLDNAGFGNAYNDYELWWAFSTTPLTAASIVINFTGTYEDSTAIVFGVAGFTGTSYQTNPWDSNVSLPATASAGTTTVPSVSNVSTSNPSTMLIQGFSTAATGTPADDVTFTNITTVSNGSGNNDSKQSAAFKLTTASSLTVSSPNTSAGWLGIVDALALDGGVTTDILQSQIWM